MDVGLTEEQQQLRLAMREFLEQQSPRALARQMEEDARGYPTDLWRQLAEMDWLSMPFPAAFGGADASITDLALLCEELGRALAPVPFQSTVVQVGLAILFAGSEAQKQRFLPPIARGELIATVAHLEPGIGYEPRHLGMRAEPVAGGYTLSGYKTFVEWAHVADEILVVARTAGAGTDGEGGLTLFLVDRTAPGLSLTPLETVADTRSFEVGFENTFVPAERIVGPVDGAWLAWRPARLRAIVCKCAEMTGGAAAAHQMSLEYAKTRIAFGRPIGAFQAIQHKLVQMQADLDGMSLATSYAAWQLDQGVEDVYAVATAKAKASAGYPEICFEGHEIHAGIGFMRDYDLQLYYRRAKLAELEFGDSQFHLKTIAQMLATDGFSAGLP